MNSKQRRKVRRANLRDANMQEWECDGSRIRHVPCDRVCQNYNKKIKCPKCEKEIPEELEFAADVLKMNPPLSSSYLLGDLLLDLYSKQNIGKITNITIPVWGSIKNDK